MVASCVVRVVVYDFVVLELPIYVCCGLVLLYFGFLDKYNVWALV